MLNQLSNIKKLFFLGNGKTYYYRVRALRKYFSPSRWVAGASGCLIDRRAVAPSSLSVPEASVTGAYAVSWGGSMTPGAAYELEEATDRGLTADLQQVYAGSLRSAGIGDRTDRQTYYYRVRAVIMRVAQAPTRIPSPSRLVPRRRPH